MIAAHESQFLASDCEPGLQQVSSTECHESHFHAFHSSSWAGSVGAIHKRKQYGAMVTCSLQNFLDPKQGFKVAPVSHLCESFQGIPIDRERSHGQVCHNREIVDPRIIDVCGRGDAIKGVRRYCHFVLHRKLQVSLEHVNSASAACYVAQKATLRLPASYSLSAGYYPNDEAHVALLACAKVLTLSGNVSKTV